MTDAIWDWADVAAVGVLAVDRAQCQFGEESDPAEHVGCIVQEIEEYYATNARKVLFWEHVCCALGVRYGGERSDSEWRVKYDGLRLQVLDAQMTLGGLVPALFNQPIDELAGMVAQKVEQALENSLNLNKEVEETRDLVRALAIIERMGGAQ